MRCNVTKDTNTIIIIGSLSPHPTRIIHLEYTEPVPDSVSDGSWGSQISVSRKRRLCVCCTVNKAGGSPGELEPFPSLFTCPPTATKQ